MKIAVIAPQFPPDTGGIQEYSWQTVCELTRKGHETVVFTMANPKCKDDFEIEVRRELTGVYSLDSALLGKMAGFDVVHVMNAAWSWFAKSEVPVVLSIHGNDFLAPNPVVGFDIKRRFSLPVGNRLDYWLSKWRTPRLMRKCLPLCKRIFANSRYTHEAFVSRFPNTRKLVETAYLGVSPEFLVRPLNVLRTSPAKPTLLTVCRLSEPRKNVDLILRALATLKTQFQFRYQIVGDGILRPALETLAQDLGIMDRVHFAGNASHIRLIEEYANADLFVLVAGTTPTSFEGFGIVYLEANSFGVPVLAARSAGAIDAVQDGVSGMFADNESVEAIAIAIRRFLTGEITFSQKLCRAHSEKFSWVSVVDRFERAYTSAGN